MSEIDEVMESLSWKSYYLGQVYMANVMKRSLLSMVKDLDEAIAYLEKKEAINE